MDIIDIVLKFIGVAGVVIIIMALFGYGVLCSWTHDTKEGVEVDDDPDPCNDPDPGEPNIIIKIPITLEVIGIFFYFLFNCSNFYFCK